MRKVSIIIPVYNAEQYIERCIQSVMQQTYDNHLIECILVDDCSTDGSYALMQHLVEHYNGSIQFLLLSHDHNQGVAAARNTGLSQASGYYIFLIDNDDILFPHCLETLTNAALKYDDADLVIGNCLNHRSNTYYNYAKEDVVITDHTEILRTGYNMTYGAFPWNKLVKRDIIQQHHLYFEQVTFDDLHWFMDMLQVIRSMVVLAEETYSYEYVETSLSHTWESKLYGTATTFLHLLKKSVYYDFKGCYVEYNFFMVFFVMHIFDYIDNHSVNSVARHEIRTIRNNITINALKRRRILVFLYDLIMYRPVRQLFYWKPVRNRAIPFRIQTAKAINRIYHALHIQT